MSTQERDRKVFLSQCGAVRCGGLPLLHGLDVARVACLFLIGAWDDDGKYLDFAYQYVW